MLETFTPWVHWIGYPNASEFLRDLGSDTHEGGENLMATGNEKKSLPEKRRAGHIKG